MRDKRPGFIPQGHAMRFSLLVLIVTHLLNGDNAALGMQPALAGASVGADIRRVVVGDDVIGEHCGPIVFNLVRIAGMADQVVTRNEAVRFAVVLVQQSGAGEDDVKFGLSGVRVHGEISFAGRELGQLDIEGMSTAPRSHVLETSQSE